MMNLLTITLLILLFTFICIRVLAICSKPYNKREYFDNENENSEGKNSDGNIETGEIIEKDGPINYITVKPITLMKPLYIKEEKMDNLDKKDKKEEKGKMNFQPIIINIKIENEIKPIEERNSKNSKKSLKNSDTSNDDKITKDYLKSAEYLKFGSPIGSTDNAKIKKETVDIFTDQDPRSYTYLKNRYYTFPQQRYSLTELSNIPKE